MMTVIAQTIGVPIWGAMLIAFCLGIAFAGILILSAGIYMRTHSK